MSFNKVIINDEVKLDLSQDTAAAANVEKGFTFHNADGEVTIGTMERISTEPDKYYELLKLIVDNDANGALSNLKANYPTQFNTLLSTIKTIAGEA